MRIPLPKLTFAWIDIPGPCLRLRFGLRAQLLAVALLGLGLAGWPLVERRSITPARTTAILQVSRTQFAGANTLQTAINEASLYLHSPQALYDIREDPLALKLTSPPSPVDMQRIRLASMYDNLVICSMETNDPIRDQKILDASIVSLMKGAGKGRFTILMPAVSVRSPLRHRVLVVFVYTLVCLFLSAIFVMTSRALRSRARAVAPSNNFTTIATNPT